MDLLARREHSRLELERKLGARSFDAGLVADVLDELAAENLQSDERFAGSFVESRVARGQGPLRIRRELAERGIATAGDWLDGERYDWGSLARQARIRRFGAELPGDLKARSRQTRFLEYRGFRHDEIKAALEFDDE